MVRSNDIPCKTEGSEMWREHFFYSFEYTNNAGQCLAGSRLANRNIGRFSKKGTDGTVNWIKTS